MGGRGASSGMSSVKAMTVSKDGRTQNYYFFKGENGKNYYATKLSETPRETPMNLNFKEFKDRAEKKGSIVVVKTNKQIKAEKKSFAENKKANDIVLNDAYANDKHFTKGMRQSRKGNRATKRGV